LGISLYMPQISGVSPSAVKKKNDECRLTNAELRNSFYFIC
jgi:hypothetical protein